MVRNSLLQGIVMGIFDLLKKKQPRISKEELLPHLTACLITSMEAKDGESDTFKTTASIDDTVKAEKLSSVSYSVDPLLAYKDEDGTYGWIYFWNEYEDTVTYYLVLISKNETYKTLLSLKLDYLKYEDGYVHSFESVLIPSFEDGLTKTIKALIKNAEFNSYSSPPPYCVFAKMLKS